ncbi:MAG: four-carbon acid sugar kinase family protein [Lachnospiraceae bacterium]
MKLDASILEKQKKVDEALIDRLLNQEIKASNVKIVVLDDDPTGVQTVHNVSVYTDWTKESIAKGFQETNNLFYILTNSRGFTVAQTEEAHRQIAQTVSETAAIQHKGYLLVSRSDSTLRGHYPLETETLKSVMEEQENKVIDGEILCPFFKEGQRFTLNDIHYVRYGTELIPAGETEFAKDKTFGYTSSDLKAYIEEKTQGRYQKEKVVSISLEELRNVNLDGITQKLMEVKHFNKVVVNAVDDVDVKVFCIALYRAMSMGKTYLFRTAASFVKALGGITTRELLTKEDMVKKQNANGGIVVVGSHTDKTTRQLEELKKVQNVECIEFNSDLVLDPKAFEEEIQTVLKKEEQILKDGKTVVIYTKRKLLVVAEDSEEDALVRSVKISDAVQSLVGKLNVEPQFVIAKGGITSSDVGTKALAVKRATVLGQIRPGIPVWETGSESKFPNVPYVIFPGNVGEDTTLREAVEVFCGKKNA